MYKKTKKNTLLIRIKVMVMEKRKPRVLFPFTEAGMGHIMPLRALVDTFEKKYGDKVEIVRSQFFTETGEPKLKIFEEKMCDFVKKQNRQGVFGKFTTLAMDVFGTKIDTWACMRVLVPGSKKLGVAHMDELNVDLVVTTHWATNYYAKCSKKNIKTVVYCPDAHINPLFAYDSDLLLISMPYGYEKALKNKKRFNKDNLKLVPFCIRLEAFDISLDKKQNRRELGLDEEKFTVVLAEGGYGIGKMERICEEVIKRDLPITLIPICGKNEELYNRFLKMEVGKNTILKPQGFTDKILRYMASADLFCGKSGASSIAEPTFFGVPSIITKHATKIETIIAKNYVEHVKCAVNLFKPKAIVDKIEEYLSASPEFEQMKKNALAIHDFYGAEMSADYIFDLLCQSFPDLKG